VKSRTGTIQGLLAFICIVAGVAFIFWPAALVVAGLLLIIDLVT
jgi:hypothetical protein